MLNIRINVFVSFIFGALTIIVLFHVFLSNHLSSNNFGKSYIHPEQIFNRKFSVFQEFQSELNNAKSGNEVSNINFQPSADSLNRHQIPNWWRDGKLGIFIHWGLYSVPGFSPTDYMFHDDVPKEIHVKYNPYAEWYMNTMRYQDSPTQKYHNEKYGGRPYIDFVPDFNAEIVKWNPNVWAKVFKDLKASYVVLTTKHHDGYTLWPSEIENPNRSAKERELARDIVGELSKAVCENDIVMGLYYSGGRDWSFDYAIDPQKYVPGVPQSEEYAKYWGWVFENIFLVFSIFQHHTPLL